MQDAMQGRHPTVDESLETALRAVRPQPRRDAAQIAERVVRELRDEIEIGAALQRVQPRQPDKSAARLNIMARIHDGKPGMLPQRTPSTRLESDFAGQLNGDHPHNSPLLRWKRAAVALGSAAALVLLALALHLPDAADQGSEAKSAASALKDGGAAGGVDSWRAEPVLRSQVRQQLTFFGESCYIIDAGSVQGIREGDELMWQSTGGTGHTGLFEVRAVSPFYSVCKPASSTGAPHMRDQVDATRITPAMRRARLEKRETTIEPGAFYGFGMMLNPRSSQATVHEVLPRYWVPGTQIVEPTLAAQLGLRAGDRIVAVNGILVTTLSDVVDAMSALDQGQTQWHMRVVRGTDTLDLMR